MRAAKPATAIAEPRAHALPLEALPAVQARGLTRRFGERTALDGVSFSLAPGERLALLGPNGSGKSTLLRLLATLLRPTSGSARVAGHDVVAEPAAARRALGTAFQSPSLDGKLSVAENLRFQGWLYGLSGAALSGRIGDLLARFSLASRAGDLAETLSGGMKRRVELAKTLLHRPQVLLLDEPSTGLDPAARLEFWDVLTEAQSAGGLALIAATHLLDEAERCDRVALLSDGRLVAIDTPEALKARVGGQVVTVECADPATLAPRIAERFGLQAAVAGSQVRLAPGAGMEVAARILETFPREARAVRLGHPSLEDAFLALTGRSLGPQEAAP